MKLPFSKVIEFARSKPAEMDKAAEEFFAGGEVEFGNEEIDGLFAEWLIYNFRQSNGLNFLAEYCLNNPNNLDEDLIQKMEEVLGTAKYSLFQIKGVEKGVWIELEDLFSGELYRVWDKIGSSQFDTGTIYTRVAKIAGKYCLVGANPIYMPVTHTDRSKKFMKENFGGPKVTPRDVLSLLRQKKQRIEAPPKLTLSQLKILRETCEQEYKKGCKKYDCSMLFEELLKIIYEEDSQSGDFWQDLMKMGLPEEFLLKETLLFQNIWNCFPHRVLGSKSPIEAFAELKG